MKKYPKLRDGLFAVQYNGENSKELLAEIEPLGLYQDEDEAKYFRITDGDNSRLMFYLDHLLVFPDGDFEVMDESEYKAWFGE